MHLGTRGAYHKPLSTLAELERKEKAIKGGIMCIFLAILSSIVAALFWCLWCFGVAGEYPIRVLILAIVSTVVCFVCTGIAKATDEGRWF